MGLMRFLLAMSVVAGHMPATTRVLIPGGLAVEVFFSISGFYMSLILSGKYRNRATFYVNRFLRLYPVYLVVIVATWVWFLVCWMYMGRLPTAAWVEAYHHMSWAQVGALVISNWTMIGLDIPSLFHFSADQGFLLFHSSQPVDAQDGAKWAGEFRTIVPAWSLGVEIWFYLMAPFLVALSSRWIVLIGLLSVALKIAMAKCGLQTYFFFPAQLCFFMAGMLLHRAHVGAFIEKLDGRVRYAVVMLVFAVFVLFEQLPGAIGPYVVYATLIPAIPVLFVWTRKSQFDANVGNLSYSIYIVHMLILGMASNILHQVNVHVNDNVLAVTIVMVVVLTSIMLYIFVEKPIDEIRQRRASEDSQCTSDVAAIVLAPLSRWGARRKIELLAK